jgi:fatty acid desaturase
MVEGGWDTGGGTQVTSLDPSWRAKSDAYGWFSAARICASVLALTAVGPVVALHLSPWVLVLLAPFLGGQIYKTTILVHDCVHGTLFATRRWNRRVGWLAGALVGLDFKAFARLHATHHRRYGQPDDPQGDDYLGLERASRWQLIWHLVRPMTGSDLAKLLQIWRHVRSDGQVSTVRYVLLLAGVQAGIALVATAGGQLWWMIAFYPLCAATFGLLFSRIRGFCEHIALPTEASAGVVRTHLPHLIEGLFLYDLGFNYHVEHHLYPTVPSQHLPKVHRRLRELGDKRPVIASSFVSTLRKRLAASGAA